MSRSVLKQFTILGPLLAVLLAGAWIAYTVKESRLSTINISGGVLDELAAADRDNDTVTIDRLLESAWSGVESGGDKTAINEPIMLALLEMQIELHRLLGDSFRPEVPAVAADPACQTDLIEQQVIWLYAATVATPKGATSRPTASALSRLARQLACMSGLQAAVLDTAMTSSFNTVALRLQARDLDALLPYLARFVAPLQILILDARKHVGIQSAAWRWFDRWHEVLLRQISYGGWPTDRLYIWDRRYAVLAGFAPCSAGEPKPYCADITMLMHTINEPRMLGRGDCSFAGMLANGMSWTDTGQRYSCPLNWCSDRQRYVPKVPVTDAQMSFLKTLWPGGHIQDDDQRLLGELCYNTLADRQGAYHNPTYCLADFYGSRASNPFEHQLACESIDPAPANSDSTEATSPFIPDLLGVPQNPACEMLTIETQQDLPLQAGCESSENCLDFASRLLQAPDTAGDDPSGFLQDDQLALTLINPSDQGIAGLCSDPAECLTQCTALSQQISRPSACGIKPPIEVGERPLALSAEEMADPLLLTTLLASEHVREDNDPDMEMSFGSCGLGPMNIARPATHCGLVICADGYPATGFDSSCSCRSEFGGNFTRELMCGKLRCADGQLPDQNCNCYAPIPQPISSISNKTP